MVHATYDDSTEGICLSDNPDEVRFCAAEFTGKTDAEVRALLTRARPGVLDQLRERAASCAPFSCWKSAPRARGPAGLPRKGTGGKKGMTKHFFRTGLAGAPRLIDVGYDRPCRHLHFYLNVYDESPREDEEEDEGIVYASIYDPRCYFWVEGWPESGLVNAKKGWSVLAPVLVKTQASRAGEGRRRYFTPLEERTVRIPSPP